MSGLAFSTDTVNEQTALIGHLLSGGNLRIYTAPQPASPDDSPNGAEVLIEFTFQAPALDDASDGAASAKLIRGAYALTTGTAAWYRTFRSDGVPVFDGTVGTGTDANLRLEQVDLEQGALVTIQDFRYVSPRFD